MQACETDAGTQIGSSDVDGFCFYCYTTILLVLDTILLDACRDCIEGVFGDVSACRIFIIMVSCIALLKDFQEGLWGSNCCTCFDVMDETTGPFYMKLFVIAPNDALIRLPG